MVSMDLGDHIGYVSKRGFVFVIPKEGTWSARKAESKKAAQAEALQNEEAKKAVEKRSGGSSEVQPWMMSREEYAGTPPEVPPLPRPLKKLYGAKGPTEEQAAEHRKQTSARAKGLKKYKAYVERSNEHYASVRDAYQNGDMTLGEVRAVYPQLANELERSATTATQATVRKLKQDVRGKITFTNGRAMIEVFTRSGGNMNTLMHEIGHFFLENLREAAQQLDCPSSIVAAWRAVSTHFGLDELRPQDEIPEDVHEKFAGYGEKYFESGIAPVSSLADVFRRLRDWAVALYRSIMGTSHSGEVPEEIRAVFDTLLRGRDDAVRGDGKHIARLTKQAMALDGMTENGARDIARVLEAHAEALAPIFGESTDEYLKARLEGIHPEIETDLDTLREKFNADNVTPEEFVAARDRSGQSPFITPKTPDEMRGDRLFLSDDGVGFAITPEGDMVSVFNNSGRAGAGEEAIVLAIAEGAKTCDCIAGHLDGYYPKFGFKEAWREKWNDDYAPKGWDYERFGRPDVVGFSYPDDLSRNPADVAGRLRAAQRAEPARRPGVRSGIDAEAVPATRGGVLPERANQEPAAGATGVSGEPVARELEQPAYHGSGKKGIERLDDQYIGTGDGGAAFGHGHYSSQSRKIGEGYRTMLGGPAEILLDGEPATKDSVQRVLRDELSNDWRNRVIAAQLIDRLGKSGSVDAAIDELSSLVDQFPDSSYIRRELAIEMTALEHLRQRIEVNPGKGGQLYELEIPDDKYLAHWDHYMDEQPAAVRYALIDSGLWDRVRDTFELTDDKVRAIKFSDFYSKLSAMLGSDVKASAALNKAGVPGHTYYAERYTAGLNKDVRNFVVYSGDNAKITRTFYQRVSIPATEEEAEKIGFFKTMRHVGKVLGQHSAKDISALEKKLRQAWWMAKENADARALLDVQTSRDEEVHANIERGLRPVAEAVESLDAKLMPQLRGLIFKLDGKALEGVTAAKFTVDGEDAEGNAILVPNQEHYDQIRKAVLDAGVAPAVAETYIAIRKSLDGAQHQVYDMMREMRLKKDIIGKFRNQMGAIQNYFPHIRFGTHYITVNDPNAAEGERRVVHREHVDGAGPQGLARMTARVRELEARHPGMEIKFGKVEGLPEEVYDLPVSAANMAQILDEATKGMGEDLRERLRDAVASQVADTLSKRGWAGHTIKRTDVPGYEVENIGRVLLAYHTGLQGWLGKIRAAHDFAPILSKMKSSETPRLYAWAQQYVRDMLRNRDKMDRLISMTRTALFIGFLGGNLKSAIVNLTQNGIAGVPRLSVESGLGRGAVQYVQDALRTVVYMATRGRSGGMMRGGEAAFLKDFYDRGLTQANFMAELSGALDANLSTRLRGIVNVLAWPMQIAERFNRTSLALAAYRIARDGKIVDKATLERYGRAKGEKFDEEQAKDFAREIVLDSHFLTGKANQPEIVRGTTRALAPMYTFRSFSHGLLSLWRHLFINRGWRGKAAVGYSLAATATLGGLISLPLYGTIMGLLRQTGGDDWDKELRDKIAQLAGKGGADVALYGIGALAGDGFTISGSLGMELPIFADLRGDKPYLGQVLGNLSEVAGVPVAVLEKASRSISFFNRGDAYRGVEEAMPTAVANIMQAIRLRNEGATAATGRPIAEFGGKEQYRFTDSEAVGKALGFQPISKAQAFSAKRAIEDVDSYRKTAQDRLLTRYVKARRAGDTEGVDDVLQDWREYNAKMRAEGKTHLLIEPLGKLARKRMKPEQPSKRTKALTREYRESLGG
jgi:hypothetical protein